MAGHFQLRNRHWSVGTGNRSVSLFSLAQPRVFVVLLLLLSTLAPLDAAAPSLDEPPEDPATARLIADVTAIEPGKTFRLGVHFRMEHHWHIYWHSAREGGLGTQVLWQHPAGLKMSPLSWPVPKRYNLEGDLIAFGYEDEVLIFTEVTVDPDFKAEGPVEIGAQLSWLVCKKVCLIGQGNPKLELPVGTAQPANRALFDRFSARLPQSPAQAKKSGVTVSEKFLAKTETPIPEKWQITVEWPKAGARPPKEAFHLFPFDFPGATLGLGSVETDGARAVFTFSIDVYDRQEFRPARVGAVISWEPPPEEEGASGATSRPAVKKTSALRVTHDAQRASQ